MRSREAAVEDTADEMKYPPIVCNQPDDVSEVHALDGFRLFVKFNDGTTGIVDVSAAIHSREGELFRELASPEAFANVHVEYGAVTWANGLDLAPDAMYSEFKRNGEWVLR